MNVTLARAHREFVDAQVRSGRYVDASDVVRDAVRLLQARHSFTSPGDVAGGDIMALAFLVVMEAAKSAREDLQAIMAAVKAINAAKATLRERLLAVRRDCAANATRRGGEALDFSRGLGSERAYHRAPLPQLDPDSPGGVRMVDTDLHPGRIRHREELYAVADALGSQLDSLGDVGQMEAMRLQSAMDRLSKLMAILSNVARTAAEAASAITQNIK
jgi:Arc/MetJ-type ribon-helix-helix transcriptional regulator